MGTEPSLTTHVLSNIPGRNRMNKPKLGSGERFAELKNKLAHRPGVTNPAALAASIGRKKYGAKKMSALAKHGMMRANRGK